MEQEDLRESGTWERGLGQTDADKFAMFQALTYYFETSEVRTIVTPSIYRALTCPVSKKPRTTQPRSNDTGA